VWYALLMAAVVVLLSAFLVLKLRADLESIVEREVRDGSVQISRGYVREGSHEFREVSDTVLPHGNSAAQVLAPGGRVVASYGEPIARRLLIPKEMVGRALEGERQVTTVKLGADRYRVVVRRARRLGRDRVIVVAESLRYVDESVRQVLLLLLLALPAALAAIAAGGWWLARKGLRPVERMTSQAEDIGIDRLHERIEVPAAQDEIGHLAVTLNAMLDRLERGVEEKHRLVADASHELRTPLAAMRAELDVSLMDDELDPTSREVLESTREEVDRMGRIVNNLLTLARADEGRLELLRGRVDLADAIEAAARPLRPLATAKRIRLEVDGRSCEADADPESLQLALTNFIENAIKFSEPDGEVRVTAWRSNGEVGVTVKDSGPGIAPAARAQVFDRFYRADPARRREGSGSGLGLSICREIAEAHGGRVWVESEEGKGSAFSLALPGAP
jgi:heavy metal sensor kinase